MVHNNRGGEKGYSVLGLSRGDNRGGAIVPSVTTGQYLSLLIDTMSRNVGVFPLLDLWSLARMPLVHLWLLVYACASGTSGRLGFFLQQEYPLVPLVGHYLYLWNLTGTISRGRIEISTKSKCVLEVVTQILGGQK